MRWTIPILPLIVALGVSVTGCATIRAHQTAETEQVLAAAGFQVEPAVTPEKLAHLQTLTPRKVVQDVRDGQPISRFEWLRRRLTDGMAKVVTYGVGTPLEVILTEQDGRSLADRITPVRLAR